MFIDLPGEIALAAGQAVSLRLYMDVHVRHPVTTALRVRGVKVLTAQEDSAAQLDQSREEEGSEDD